MKILGLDPGTAKTGVTYISGTVKKPIYETEIIGYDCEQEKMPKIDERLLYILPILLEKIDKIKPELVIYEYPFNIKGHARVLVEFIGVIRFHCLKNGIKYVALPQTRIKKYATGKGRCEKSDMRMQAYKELGIDAGEDICDAVWVCHFGMGLLYPETIKKEHRLKSINEVKYGKPKKAKKEEAE